MSNNNNNDNNDNNKIDNKINILYNKILKNNNNLNNKLEEEIIELVLLKKKHIVYSNKEINSFEYNIHYPIIVADTEIKIKLFILYCLVYDYQVKNDKDNYRFYLGMDFEFNKQQIALMQLNFETKRIKDKNKNTFSFIWLVYPPDLKTDKKIYNIWINNIITNNKIYKILHGSDSLDIPYLYNTQFEGNKDIIFKFTKKLIDTRFLCEYYKISINETKKCTIYDALLSFNTISKNKYDYLIETHDKMGPVEEISWNINTLTEYYFMYAYYDVLFLKHFVKDIYNMAKNNTPHDYNFFKYINALTRYSFVDKNVLNITKNIKEEINMINNNYIKPTNSGNRRLINIYNYLINDLVLKNTNFNYNKIMQINNFRTPITFIFKKIVYHLVVRHFDVYKDKNNKMTNKIYGKELFDKLEKYEQNKILEILREFYKVMEKKILNKYK